MARFELQFRESVAKDLRSIPKNDVKRILTRIEKLPPAVQDYWKKASGTSAPTSGEEEHKDHKDHK